MPTVSHPPLHRLERHAIGALDPFEQLETDAHLGHCEACRQRARAIGTARETFLVAHPPRAEIDRLLRRRGRRYRGPTVRWAVGVAVVAASVSAVAVLAPRSDDVRFKGEPALRFEVKATPNAAVRLGIDGEALPSGAALSLELEPADFPSVVVLALDARGEITELGAREVSGSMRWPQSFVLDDEPGPERIFVVFFEPPLDREKLIASLQRAFDATERNVEAAIDLVPEGAVRAAARSILIRKEP